MVTSKIIRRNKEFPKSVESKNIVPTDLEDLVIRGRSAPIQDIIRRYVFEHPNCTQNEIKESILPDMDGGGFRHIMRTMIESRRIRQRFTID